jgi:hypothetical protein
LRTAVAVKIKFCVVCFVSLSPLPTPHPLLLSRRLSLLRGRGRGRGRHLGSALRRLAQLVVGLEALRFDRLPQRGPRLTQHGAERGDVPAGGATPRGGGVGGGASRR